MRKPVLLLTFLAFLASGAATAEPSRDAPGFDPGAWISETVRAALETLTDLASRAASSAADYFPEPDPIGGNSAADEADYYPNPDPIGAVAGAPQANAHGSGGGGPEHGEYFPQPDPIG
ncbi:MAG: hypothetical protein MI919_36305 [Holophagales bacterium]|nr:hypothetical protein [Holophagales bacterium]